MRIGLLLILSITFTSVFSQEYFNNRFFLGEQNGSIDDAHNALMLEDGYAVSGGTSGFVEVNYYRFAITKFDFEGEIVLNKSWGDDVSIWYSERKGSFQEHNNYYYTLNARRGSVLKESKLVKYNNNFDTVFSISYKTSIYPHDTNYIGRSFTCIDNGFVITGTLERLHDLKGENKFRKLSEISEPLQISERNDGWYSTHDLFILKTDSLGNHIWESVFPDSTYKGEGNSVIQTPDGGYAIGAHKWFSGPYGVTYGDPIIIKTDSLGNKEWEVNLGTSWPDGTAIVCNSIDSNIVVATSVAVDSGWNIYYERTQITKLDLEGNIIWNNLYGPKILDNSFNVSNIRQDSVGGFIVSGRTNYSEVWPDEPSIMGYMLRINNNGDSLWYRQYANLWGKHSENYFYDVIPTTDGGFLGAGSVLPFNPDTGNRDAWIIKVDSMGCTSLTDCWVGVPEWKWITTESGNKIKVYPNPAHNWFEVSSSAKATADKEVEVEVFDLFGRKVEETEIPKGKNNLKFYVSDWNRGVYLVRVKSDSEVLGSGKVVLE